MPIELNRNEVILPDKKDEIIAMIRNEINLAKDDIRNKRYGDAVLQSMQRNVDTLQSMLNKFLNKTGVITMAENNGLIDALDDMKKNRMKSEVNVDKIRLIYWSGVIVVAGVVTYLIVKKFRK